MTSDWNFHVEGHTVATASDPDRAATRVDTPVYSFVIDHPEGTILVDTGSHPDAGGLDNFDGTDTPVFVHEEEPTPRTGIDDPPVGRKA